MIATIIQEDALLEILRVDTRLYMFIEPRIQAGTGNTNSCVSMYSHCTRESGREVCRITSCIRTKVQVQFTLHLWLGSFVTFYLYDIPQFKTKLPHIILPDISPTISSPAPHLLRRCRPPLNYATFHERREPFIPPFQPSSLLTIQAPDSFMAPKPHRNIRCMRHTPFNWH